MASKKLFLLFLGSSLLGMSSAHAQSSPENTCGTFGGYYPGVYVFDCNDQFMKDWCATITYPPTYFSNGTCVVRPVPGSAPDCYCDAAAITGPGPTPSKPPQANPYPGGE